jgi:hypothetical protein
MRKIILLFIVLPSLVFAEKKQPSFKGVPFGVGASTFLSLYKPGGQWGSKGGVPQVVLNEASRAVTIMPPVVSGVSEGRIYSGTLKDSVANLDAQIVLFFAVQSEQDMALMKSGVSRTLAERALFSEVFASFEARAFEHLLDASRARYGEPTIIHADVGICEWDTEELFVRLQARYEKTGRCALTIKAKTVKSMTISAAAAEM